MTTTSDKCNFSVSVKFERFTDFKNIQTGRFSYKFKIRISQTSGKGSGGRFEFGTVPCSFVWFNFMSTEDAQRELRSLAGGWASLIKESLEYHEGENGKLPSKCPDGDDLGKWGDVKRLHSWPRVLRQVIDDIHLEWDSGEES